MLAISAIQCAEGSDGHHITILDQDSLQTSDFFAPFDVFIEKNSIDQN